MLVSSWFWVVWFGVFMVYAFLTPGRTAIMLLLGFVLGKWVEVKEACDSCSGSARSQ
jgi:hypothetical protein